MLVLSVAVLSPPGGFAVCSASLNSGVPFVALQAYWALSFRY